MTALARLAAAGACLALGAASFAVHWQRHAFENGRISALSWPLQAPGSSARLAGSDLVYRAGEDRLDAAPDLAAASPLDPFPFEAALLDAAAAGDLVRAETTARRALARDPRSLPARRALAKLAALGARFDPAVEHLIVLIRLDRTRAADYVAGLAAIAETEAGFAAVWSRLESAPWWGGDLARRLYDAPISEPRLVWLARLYPETQGAYLRRIERDGGLDRAYAAWLDLQPDPARAAAAAPFDPRFEGGAGARPFNWRLDETAAQRRSGGGLQVRHDGRGARTIVEQTVALPPGSGTLKVRARGAAPPDAGDLRWRLACASDNRSLAELAISGLAMEWTQRGETFSIPETNCRFQKLALEAGPGLFPQPTAIEIDRVDLAPIDPGEG